MDVRRLEMFLAVVDTGSFTRASPAVYVSQPGMSKAIAELERDLGSTLFDRVGRGVQLTDAGRALVGPARRVLTDVEEVRAEVAGVGALQRGTLSVGSLRTLSADPIVPLLGRFRSAYPGVRVLLADPDDQADLMAMLRAGRVELAIGEPGTARGVTSIPLGRQELVAVLPPGSPAPRSLGLGALAAMPLVVTPPGTSSRRLLDEALDAAGHVATVAVETAQRDALLPLVIAGAGTAVLPRPLAEIARTFGAAVVPLRPAIRREVALVHRAAPLSRAAERFVGLAT